MAELARVSARTGREVERTSREMREFKEENRKFWDQSRRDREAREKTWRAELAVQKEESRRERVEWRRQWGELSNKMGTMAEDLVAPSIGRILRTVIGCPEDRIDSVAVRVRRRSTVDRGRMQEFDVVAVCGEHALVNETKSRLMPEHIAAFLEHLATVRDYFPEFEGKMVIGAIASLYVDESLVQAGEKQGLVVLGFGEDVMDVLTSPGFVPRTF